MTLPVAGLAVALAASQPPQAVLQRARVSGRVIEEGTQTPVAGARVFVILDGGFSTRSSPPGTLTDRDGRYRFDALPAGRYHIAAQKAAFAPSMDPSTMQPFEVSDGQVLDGLTVSLQRGGVITGRILDSYGQPLAEVGVTALLKRLNTNDQSAGPASLGAPLLMPAGQNQTNDLGEFRIYGLSSGEYVISANPRSDFDGAPTSATMMTSTYFPETADASAAEPVTVRAGATVSDLTIRLVAVRAFQVSGVVVNESGVPMPDVMVTLLRGRQGREALLSLGMGQPGMSQSDAAGRFSFANVAAGLYMLRADSGSGGIFATSDDFIIDRDGTPRAGPARAQRARAPGTIEVTIDNENVTDLKLVVPRSQ